MNAVLEKPARKIRAPKAAPAPEAKAPETTVEPAVNALLAVAPKVAPKQFSKEQLKKLYWEAFGCMTNAFSVLLHYAEHAEDSAVFAIRDLLEVYLAEAEPRVEDDGNVEDYLFDMSADLSKTLALVEAFAISNDDTMMHGIADLLSCAQRIADGDKGVLDA